MRVEREVGYLLAMLNLDDQNRWRDHYRAQQPGWQPATEFFAERVRRRLAKAAPILDLGCGRGGLVEQLGLDSAPLWGLDPDLASLITHRLPDFPRTAGSASFLPWKSSSFDLIYASWLLEHLARPSRSLSEIHRVLRPGGEFIFITPNGGHPLTLFNRLIGRLGSGQKSLVEILYGRHTTDTFPAYYRANSIATLRALALQGGMRLTEISAIPDPSYLALSPTLFRLSALMEEALPPSRRLHLVGTMQRVQ